MESPQSDDALYTCEHRFCSIYLFLIVQGESTRILMRWLGLGIGAGTGAGTGAKGRGAGTGVGDGVG